MQDADLGTWLLSQAIMVYAGSSRVNDFFLLHGATGAWALQQVLPLLDVSDKIKVARDFVNTLVAVYAAQGQPEPLGI